MSHKFKFGKHAGATVKEVGEVDGQYLEWLATTAVFKNRRDPLAVEVRTLLKLEGR